MVDGDELLTADDVTLPLVSRVEIEADFDSDAAADPLAVLAGFTLSVWDFMEVGDGVGVSERSDFVVFVVIDSELLPRVLRRVSVMLPTSAEGE